MLSTNQCDSYCWLINALARSALHIGPERWWPRNFQYHFRPREYTVGV